MSKKTPRKQFRAKVEKYTHKQFEAQFPDDTACLADIFRRSFPNGLICPECTLKDRFYPITGRRAYSCVCGYQVYPTAGSIFHKPRTSLKTWYFAMYLLTTSRNGVAALEIQRQTGVTYKTAWRMMHQIRQLMADELPPMTGIVEVDETYVGGKRPGKRGRGAEGKTIIVGAVERGKGVAPFVVERANAETAENLVEVCADKSAKIITDEYGAHHGLKGMGYDPEVIQLTGVLVQGLPPLRHPQRSLGSVPHGLSHPPSSLRRQGRK